MNAIEQTPHTPYFYVIEEVATGRKYAGSRWSKEKTKYSDNGCHPIELLRPDGYATSSTHVNKIMQDNGPESFVVNDIITFDEISSIPFGWSHIRDFETTFLLNNDCAGSDDWLNLHNNYGNVNSPTSVANMVIERSKIGYDGLTSFQRYGRVAEETKRNTISENGLSIRENSTIKSKESKMLPSEEYPDKTINEAAALKRDVTMSNDIDSNGLNAYQRMGSKISASKSNMLPNGRTIAQHAVDCSILSGKIVDPITGKTYKQLASEKASITRKLSGIAKGSNNPNAMRINIYDKDGQIQFECHGNFTDTCKVNNLPDNALTNSYANDGEPIYQKVYSNRKRLEEKGYMKLQGWYAKVI